MVMMEQMVLLVTNEVEAVVLVDQHLDLLVKMVVVVNQ